MTYIQLHPDVHGPASDISFWFLLAIFLTFCLIGFLAYLAFCFFKVKVIDKLIRDLLINDNGLPESTKELLMYIYHWKP